MSFSHPSEGSEHRSPILLAGFDGHFAMRKEEERKGKRKEEGRKSISG